MYKSSLSRKNTCGFAVLSILFFSFFFYKVADAQVTLDAVIRVTATTSSTVPHITLTWPFIPNTGSDISIWRRVKGSSGTASWGTPTVIPGSSTSYADATASPGVVYDYSMQCTHTSSSVLVTAYGGISAGYNIPLVESRGNAILLVDSSMTTTLSAEIEQFQRNLIADGWAVLRHDIARQSYASSSNTAADNATRRAVVPAVRAIVQGDYNNNGGSSVNWSLIILGHVPVPYSGVLAPDGHGDHRGAWPTDTYYADVDGVWIDTSVTSGALSTLQDPRNYNVPGDGKFDQYLIARSTSEAAASAAFGKVEIACGRIDLAGMDGEPVGMTEPELLRQYLVRNHNFRRNLPPYNTVPRRGLIDDNFAYRGGAAFASSGWRAGGGYFGYNSGQMDVLDWFDTLGTTSMLFAYGCGGGSFTSCDGVGTSAHFNRGDSKAVFNVLFGSYFGDWDKTDGLLRCPLAGTANSLGLTCVWSGYGYFHLYHMGLGDVIGNDVRLTQNYEEVPYYGAWPTTGDNGFVSYNLMGDPTLRLHSIAPPSRVTATSTSSGITLSWAASTDTTLSGYHVYRGTSTVGPFIRITGIAASGTNPTGSCLSTSTLSYTDTDSSLVAGTAYTYQVKAVRMEVSASGTYANQSLGEVVNVTHLAASQPPMAPTRLVVTRTATGTCALAWDDNANDETGYLVERRDPSTGLWGQIITLSPNATSYTDSAANAGAMVHYRVRAAGINSTFSDYSNTATDTNRPGLVYDTAYSYMVSKLAGTLSTTLARFNGSVGSVSASYTTSTVLGSVGNDYNGAVGTLTWPHGDMGTKSSAGIVIKNVAGNQLTKIFQIAYGNPTNGLALNTPSTTYVFIQDPASQTLPVPWTTTTVGTIGLGYEGYAEEVGGTFGLAVCSAGVGGSSPDSYRFISKSVSGDFQLTARLALHSYIAPNARSGLFVRNSLTNPTAAGLSLLRSSSTSYLAYRTTDGGTNTTTTPGGGVSVPGWVRLVRSGNSIVSQTSSDGTTWTAVPPSVNVSGLGTIVQAGLALTSGNVTDPTHVTGSMGYARFDNVTLYTPPVAVSGLAVSTSSATTSGQIGLSWTASSDATSYYIERSTSSNSGFVQISISANAFYTDTNLVPGQTYYYRVKATNPAYTASSYSTTASTTPYIPPTLNGWRYTYFGTESPTGNAAPLACPAGDGITNIMKYALGLNPLVAYNQASLPSSQIQDVSSQRYLTCTFNRNTIATDLTYTIEVTSDPSTSWTVLDPLAGANQVSSTLSGSIQTITVKDTQPTTSSGTRFIRLKVTGP